MKHINAFPARNGKVDAKRPSNAFAVSAFTL